MQDRDIVLCDIRAALFKVGSHFALSSFPRMRVYHHAHPCHAAAALLCMVSLAKGSPLDHVESSNSPTTSSICHYLPSDAAWPTQDDWSAFNATTEGKLILASPLAVACHGSNYDVVACGEVQETWTDVAK